MSKSKTEITALDLYKKLRLWPEQSIVQMQFHTDPMGNPKSTTLQLQLPDGKTVDLWVWDGFDSKQEVEKSDN